jgi:hypothetical protein
MRAGKSLAVLLLCFVPLLRSAASPVASNAAFEKMKTLVGTWHATSPTGIQNADFQLIADGSVLASRLSGGMPHDMHTMFHMDAGHFMLTHYCAMHNQSRMVLVSGGDANKLVFEFKDGTNIKPGDVHMNRVAFIINGPNHHVEEWTHVANGRETTTRCDFRRKQ